MRALYPPKLLRLLYYCFYKAALTKNNSTPKLSSSITMAFTHGIQLLFLVDALKLFFGIDVWNVMSNVNGKIIFAIAALALLFIVDRLYTYQDRHLQYMTEFEEAFDRRKRTKYILVGCSAAALTMYVLQRQVIIF